MMRNYYIIKHLLFMSFVTLTSCSFNNISSSKVVCENIFTLTSDSQCRFPDQDDYMQYLKSGYYKTYYEDSTCSFHLEYRDGTVIDDTGTYIIENNRFYMTFSTISQRTPYFMVYYPWSTADTHIIDSIEINGNTYSVCFYARYWETSIG